MDFYCIAFRCFKGILPNKYNAAKQNNYPFCSNLIFVKKKTFENVTCLTKADSKTNIFDFRRLYDYKLFAECKRRMF